MEVRGAVEEKKEKVTQYTKHQGNIQVEGRGNIFQETIFVRHMPFAGRKWKGYNILKEKDHNIICVVCAHVALKRPHKRTHVGWEMLISQGKNLNPLT